MRKLLLTLIAVLMIGAVQAAGTATPAECSAAQAERSAIGSTAPAAGTATPAERSTASSTAPAAGSAASSTAPAASSAASSTAPAAGSAALGAVGPEAAGALMAPSAQARLSAEVLASLCSQRVRDRSKAIDELIAQGEVQLLSALRDGRLYYDRVSRELYLKTDSGFIKWATGEAASGMGLKRSGISAHQRAHITDFLNKRALHAPAAAERLAAVQALVQDPYSKISLAEVTAMMQHEDDPEVYAQLEALKALLSPEVPSLGIQELLRNIVALEAEASPAAIAALERLQQDQRPEVSAAATSALNNIALLKQVSGWAETLFFGLSLGSVLVLAALGLAVTFGVMGVINMAHGELIMLGAYTVWLLQTALPNEPGLALLLAIPVSFCVSGAFGLLIEKSVIRYLYGRPLETLLATFGLSLILQQLVRTIFSPLNRAVVTPDFLQGSVQLGPFLSLSYNRIFIIVFCLAVFVLTVGVLKHTRLGLEVRAVSQNRAMARALGIRAGRVDALTFALGSGAAGMAGVALSQITNVGPNLGQNYIIDSFMVVVFGGVGNLYGTLTGGLIMGLANKFLEPLSGAMLSKILILVALIIFIQKRPRGLFPQRGRAVED